MLRYLMAGLLVFTASAAQAQETPVSALCQILKTHHGSAAYQPGVDVNGKPVVSADVGGGMKMNQQVIEIPVEVNLVQKFNMTVGNGMKLEPNVATFRIHPDGRVMYGSQDITSNAQVVCNEGGKSSAIITPQIQQEEPKVLGTLSVKQDGTTQAGPAPAPEAQKTAAPENIPSLIPDTTSAATASAAPAPQEVPLADQYCLMNGYTKPKEDLKPGFVAPIQPVPVQPTAAAAPIVTPTPANLSAPAIITPVPAMPAGGEIVKAVPYDDNEIPGVTHNKTVPNQPLVAPGTQNITVSTTPADNTPIAITPPSVPKQMSPEAIPTFEKPVETRAQPALPVRDVDKPLARPPGMPITSSWAPPPPKSDSLAAPVAAPVPFEKTEKVMTTAPQAAPAAAHPSKSLRIDTNPLRRNLEETP